MKTYFEFKKLPLLEAWFCEIVFSLLHVRNQKGKHFSLKNVKSKLNFQKKMRKFSNDQPCATKLHMH